MDTFGDLPLFGGEMPRYGEIRKAKRKRRKARRKKKERVYKYRSMKYITALPLFNWHVQANYEGETADTFRNIIRQFFYEKWQTKEDWTEEELFSYVRQAWEFVPMVTFQEFWKLARKSKKGKLGWIDHIDKIHEDEWSDYSKLAHVKKFIRRK